MFSRSNIEALVNLTGRQDKRELTACLVENVGKITSSSTIAVYEVFNATGTRAPADNPASLVVRNTGNPSWLGEPLAMHPGFSECIVTKQVVRLVRENPTSTRIIFPVRDASGVIGLLVIDSQGADPEALFLVEAMSQIWKSQQFLLDRNERDVLTGLFNRQALDSRMSRLFGEDTEQVPGCAVLKCLAILDIDKFKDVNDRYGHLFGDEVLVHFTRLMNKSFRIYDYLFRYGGEEFVVVLQNVGLELALSIFDRFRNTVGAYDFPQVGQKTVSIGVIQLVAGQLPSTLIDKADKALYYAKQNGRNRVCGYEQLVAAGQLQESAISVGDIELF